MGTKTIISTITVSVTESFSHKENKHNGAGSGETRLYMGPQQNDEVGSFIEFDEHYITRANKKTYNTCKSSFIITKENLLEYHVGIKDIYDSKEFEDSIGNIKSLYSQRLNEIRALNEISRFEVFNQNGETDIARIYIGSTSHLWELIRRIALPRVSYIRIDKILDEETGELLYLVTLHQKDKTSIDDEVWKRRNYYSDVEKKVRNEIDENVTLSDTEKKDLVLARRGQGKFRKRVIGMMGKCIFTGVSDPNLLRASHCIPWAECETASDRLDGYNGLLLTPTYDLLFDQGYISFTDEGRLMIAECLGEENVRIFGLKKDYQYITEGMQVDMRERFLRYHREYIFKSRGGAANG